MLETTVLGFLRRKSLRKALEIERRLREKPAVPARVVCIASGKGGTGKSVVATNLAVQRASRGERVLLIDFDAGLANDHLLLGLAPKFDLGHLVEGRARALTRVCAWAPLDFPRASDSFYERALRALR